MLNFKLGDTVKFIAFDSVVYGRIMHVDEFGLCVVEPIHYLINKTFIYQMFYYRHSSQLEKLDEIEGLLYG